MSPSEILRKGLGVLVLVYVVLEITQWKPKFGINRFGLFVGSGVYGFLSGALGGGNVV